MINNTIEKITEEILSGKTKLIDISTYETKDYIKCRSAQVENFEGRWRLAFVRCPKCREYISIYKDEIYSNGLTRILKKCTCGFNKRMLLKKWNNQ